MIEKYLPKDFYWLGAKAKGKNLRNMFLGLNKEINRANDKSKEVLNELDINQTKNLLTDWENMLGIPGTLLEGLGTTLEKRRQAILVKLAALIAQTPQSFIDIAKIFDYDIIKVVSNMDDYFPGEWKKSKFTFMIDFYGKGEPARFTLTFPIHFQDNTDDFFEFFRTLIPANTQLLRYEDCPYNKWENPVIEDNGEIGGNKFAVASSDESEDAFKISDGDFNTSWSADEVPSWILFYCPYELIPQSMVVRSNNFPKKFKLEGSLNNTDWTEIGTYEEDISTDIAQEYNIVTPSGYRYFKFTILQSQGNIANIAELKIKGVYLR